MLRQYRAYLIVLVTSGVFAVNSTDVVDDCNGCTEDPVVNARCYGADALRDCSASFRNFTVCKLTEAN